LTLKRNTSPPYNPGREQYVTRRRNPLIVGHEIISGCGGAG
jgi:hypothetical protein